MWTAGIGTAVPFLETLLYGPSPNPSLLNPSFLFIAVTRFKSREVFLEALQKRYRKASRLQGG